MGIFKEGARQKQQKTHCHLLVEHEAVRLCFVCSEWVVCVCVCVCKWGNGWLLHLCKTNKGSDQLAPGRLCSCPRAVLYLRL